MFSTFDAPSGEFCLGQREMSNTPLQSLTLLNDRVVMEAAIHLGTQIQTLEASDEQRVQNLFQRILSREGRPEEIQLVLQFRTVQQERLASGEISAEQLLGDAAPANAKTTPADSESASNQPDANIIDPIVLAKQLDLAAWTLTTRALLNLDEAITRN
jgi:hypothetical protein